MDIPFFKNCFNIFTTIKEGNVAFHVTDDSESVIDVRKNLSLKYSFDLDNLKYMDQIHSNEVLVVDDSISVYRCDGLVTDKKDITLMVMVADCIPILFYDDRKKVIGAVHAGRNGTFLNISQNCIDKMVDGFACDVKDIQVIFGPSIQKCCYEVSREMADIVVKGFGEEFVKNRNIDLQGINKKQLLQKGIKEENILISDICTKCGDKEFYSYRKDKNCGRFAGLIKL